MDLGDITKVVGKEALTMCDCCHEVMKKLEKQEEVLSQLIQFVANNHERIITLEQERKRQISNSFIC